MSMYLMTRRGIVMPLCDVTAIFENELETEGFLEYKLSSNVEIGTQYVFIRTMHGEYHQVDMLNTENQNTLRPSCLASGEYLYETSLKRLLYSEWAKLRESGIATSSPIND